MALAIFAVVIGGIGYWLLIPREPTYGMFEEGAAADVLRIGLSFFATMLGVVLGSFYRTLQALKAGGHAVIRDASATLSRMLRSIDLWLALAGAPILYALLLQTTTGMNLSGLVVVALQNGFCSLIIINQLSPHVPPEPGGAAKPETQSPAG